MWLTNILSVCPSALDDNKISLAKNATANIPNDPTKSRYYSQAGALLGL